MEVLVGSALGIQVSSKSAFVRERAAAAAQAGDDLEAGFGAGRSAKSEEEEEEEEQEDSSSSKSSSIGVPGDSDEEEEEDGVVSSAEDAKGGSGKGGGFGSFGSLASLEDSLPIKRGLSNHFAGKSKSFSNLAEANLTEAVSSAKDLEKPEHPFNKRRRILRWSKNFPLLSAARSMPLFPVGEEEEDDDSDERDHREVDDGDSCSSGGGGDGERGMAAAASRFPGRHVRKHSVFKSSSCFALSDLHEEDEEGEEDEDEEGN